MAYAADDPRSNLAKNASGSADPNASIAAPQFLDFSITPPNLRTAGGSEQWLVRGQNFVFILTHPVAGDTIWDSKLSSEQVVLLVDEQSSITGTAEGDISDAEHRLSGPALAVVPPGGSTISSTGTGSIVQLLQSDETEWAAKALNADAYADPDPRAAVLEPWPEPVDGPRWRNYRMADHPVEKGRFGRIFRSRAFMINFMPPSQGPRDLAKMSPHFHQDFEQASLVMAGQYIHHIQTPWITDGTQWRPEDHARVASPSLTIIPPPTVHTSQAIDRNVNHLIDIFSGPRADFSAQPDWVRNADEYPSPQA